MYGGALLSGSCSAEITRGQDLTMYAFYDRSQQNSSRFG